MEGNEPTARFRRDVEWKLVVLKFMVSYEPLSHAEKTAWLQHYFVTQAPEAASLRAYEVYSEKHALVLVKEKKKWAQIYQKWKEQEHHRICARRWCYDYVTSVSTVSARARAGLTVVPAGRANDYRAHVDDARPREQGPASDAPSHRED